MTVLGIIPFFVTLLYMILNSLPIIIKIAFYVVRKKLIIDREVLEDFVGKNVTIEMIQILRSIVIIALIPYFMRIFKFKQVKLVYELTWKLLISCIVVVTLTAIEMMLALMFSQTLLWTDAVQNELASSGLLV